MLVYLPALPKGQVEGKDRAEMRVLLKGETKWCFKVLPSEAVCNYFFKEGFYIITTNLYG